MNDNAVKEVINWLEEETLSLKNEINDRNQTLNTLQNLINELKEQGDYSEYKEKYEEISADFEKEKERLVKLHDHYRKIEEECKNLKIEVKSWQDWFYSNKDIYEKIFSTAPPSGMSEPFGKLSLSASKPTKKKSKPKTRKK